VRVLARGTPQTAHAMMLKARWQDVAYAILAWLRERGM
jgi:hypothetical protein